MQIGFVCTNYNNSSLTRAAITSLHKEQGGRDIHIVVVDNSSEAGDVAALKALPGEFPGVELVLNSDNVGYFPGLNVGIQHLRNRYPDLNHIVVGNNDLVFPPDFVQTVERNCKVFDTWAVVAPDLVTPDGLHQNPHMVYPVSLTRRLIWDLHFLSYVSAVLVLKAARMTRGFTSRPERMVGSQLYRSPGPIRMGYGACYLLGPLFFRHFATLCAPTFMMQEEFFLAEQLKTIGQTTYYDPRFVVNHAGHASMGRIPSRRHWEISREAHIIYKRYLEMSPDEKARFIATNSRRLS